MNIHEYQAKALLQRYGIKAPIGALASDAVAAADKTRELGGATWVVKAQIHAGGRGKAGGIRRAKSNAEVEEAARQLLGTRLVTYQTGAAGITVKQVYVEQACDVERELYLAVLIDRSVGRVAILGSSEGGEDIERRAASAPETIHKVTIDPAVGLQGAQTTALVDKLGLKGEQATAAERIIAGMVQGFTELDASLIEINPLVVTKTGEVLALDVKMSFDDNALFRHEEIEALRDQDEFDASELEAKRYELNFVRLDGDIGCLVNGAGLALATLDLIKQAGGEAADFMDVRPVATREQVAHGFKMILANPKVRAVLVNVYGGGILRCDTIGEAIAMAVKEVGLNVPLILRAAGTNAEICRKVLHNQSVPFVYAKNMAEAAALAVKSAEREAA